MGPEVLSQRGSRFTYVRPGLVAAGASALTAIIAKLDLSASGHLPACPFLTLTGYYCPGCGSTRAIQALTHGDVLAAIALNPLTMAMVPLLAWCWLRWVRRLASGSPRPPPAPPVVLHAFAALVAAFGILRNLPFGAALAP